MLPSSTDAFLEALLIARPDTAPDQLSEVLATALQAGQLLLEHGASTARVEDTIRRLGRSLGAEQVEVFATPTGLFATFGVGGGHATRIQRIMRSGMDLSKIEAVLAISRQAAAGKLD
ncbi:MAG: threonine/serine exporter family protein, partial [Roseiflexaceae bacterium]|nr:threonine/serine exporter family protein [Roseiflexaceae bacterium]